MRYSLSYVPYYVDARMYVQVLITTGSTGCARHQLLVLIYGCNSRFDLIGTFGTTLSRISFAFLRTLKLLVSGTYKKSVESHLNTDFYVYRNLAYYEM
jgi:hypothetical protein